MSTPITCTFKVPTTADEYAFMGENGVGIRFSNMLDPTNASIRSSRMNNNSDCNVGEITYRPLIPLQCKAAVRHFYNSVVLPAIDHPDKDSENFFFTWLFHALPVKIPNWNIEKWKEVFKVGV